jgi:alpha-L-arabinofuranosidase
MKGLRLFLPTVMAVSAIITLHAQTKTVLTVHTDERVAEIQPTMWGVFFEDINFGADGGLYAELVKNRSFEFDEPMMGWRDEKSDKFSINSLSGSTVILNRGQSELANRRFARVKVNTTDSYALINEGFFGMGIREGVEYNFSVSARQEEGTAAFRVELLDEQSVVIASTVIRPGSSEWKDYKAVLVPKSTVAKARMRLAFFEKGITDIDVVSLFPSNTWKSRPGGLRADLVQLLYDLKPGFLRFPGGCIVEGRDLATRYQWKKTIGKPEERDVMINRWNTEFKHRPAPDYFQSFGLGFYEYFLLAEDIGASPLPILSCGMACQFNTAEMVSMDQLDPYIQDALDLIEFANGDVSTKWGKLRADMGHAKPFGLTMLGVGNEQWGQEYIARYKVFAGAIKEKYPKIKIVSGAGPFPDGELFDYASRELRELNADIVDEHYYRAPEWFFTNVTRYDSYDRTGPRIFAGEYAAQSVATVSPKNENNWQCALSEAAFMTGLERNADLVNLASYAPLLAHREGWQWTPDLIWFDNLNAYGTPSYFVQKLFANNRGTHVLPVFNGKEKVVGQDNIYGSAVWDDKSGEVVLKLVNNSPTAQKIDVQLTGKKKFSKSGSVTELKSDLSEVNSFEDPSKIKPVASTIEISGKTITPELAPYSLTVIRVKTIK